MSGVWFHIFFSFLEMSLLDTSILQLQNELVTLQDHFAMSCGASFQLFPLLDPLLPGLAPMCRGSTLSCSFLKEAMWEAEIMSVTYKRKWRGQVCLITGQVHLVLGLMFKSMFHSELIFVYSVESEFNFIFLHVFFFNWKYSWFTILC